MHFSGEVTTCMMVVVVCNMHIKSVPLEQLLWEHTYFTHSQSIYLSTKHKHYVLVPFHMTTIVIKRTCEKGQKNKEVKRKEERGKQKGTLLLLFYRLLFSFNQYPSSHRHTLKHSQCLFLYLCQYSSLQRTCHRIEHFVNFRIPFYSIFLEEEKKYR